MFGKTCCTSFPMYGNFSADVTGPKSNNLTAYRLDQLVVKDNFVTDNELSKLYKKDHEMIKEVEVSRCIAYRELIVRLQFVRCLKIVVRKIGTLFRWISIMTWMLSLQNTPI